MTDKEQRILLENQVIDVMKTIYDPEIPVNIYDLGLIYKIAIDEVFNAKITMTLTAPNCPVAESLPVEVKDKIEAIAGINEAEVEIVFEPPWSRDMISITGMLDLGMM